MRRGVLLLVCLVAAHAQTPPLSFEDVGTVQGTCGIMASGGSFHWWFNDLHNQINHAARLTIVEYGTNGNRPFTRAFFTGRSIQPTQRIGNLVMWTLNGFAQTTSAECKVRSAATESHSYTGGQCGALGFLQQNGNSQMLQGNLIEHVGPLQATTYVSIEDCCLRCANPPTAVASTATARQLQEVDSCQGLGYEEVADTYLSGGTDTAWTTGTPRTPEGRGLLPYLQRVTWLCGLQYLSGQMLLNIGQLHLDGLYWSTSLQNSQWACRAPPVAAAAKCRQHAQ